MGVKISMIWFSLRKLEIASQQTELSPKSVTIFFNFVIGFCHLNTFQKNSTLPIAKQIMEHFYVHTFNS